MFVCNRGDTYYSITAGSRQGCLAKPLSLLFLTPRPGLSSHQHRTLVCLFWSGNLHCTAGCIQQLKLLFPWHLAIPGFPQSAHTVSKLSADADSLWSTVKQASRPQVILKTQPPICLDYRARNRPQLVKKLCWKGFNIFSSKLAATYCARKRRSVFDIVIQVLAT